MKITLTITGMSQDFDFESGEMNTKFVAMVGAERIEIPLPEQVAEAIVAARAAGRDHFEIAAGIQPTRTRPSAAQPREGASHARAHATKLQEPRVETEVDLDDARRRVAEIIKVVEYADPNSDEVPIQEADIVFLEEHGIDLQALINNGDVVPGRYFGREPDDFDENEDRTFGGDFTEGFGSLAPVPVEPQPEAIPAPVLQDMRSRAKAPPKRKRSTPAGVPEPEVAVTAPSPAAGDDIFAQG